MLKLTFRMKMHPRLGNARSGLAVVHLADAGSLPGTLLTREYERDLRASPRWIGRAERQMDPEPRLQALLDRFVELYESHPTPDWECTDDALRAVEIGDALVRRNDPFLKETPMHPDLQKLVRKDLPLDPGAALVVASPYDRYHELKIVTDYDLPDATKEGWRLVAIVQEQGYMMAAESIPNPNPSFGGMIATQRAMPSITTRYVVGRDETSALAAAHRLREAAEEKTRAAVAELKNHAAQAQAAERLGQENVGLKERLKRETENLQTALKFQQDRVRRYEVDLGRIRAALGDLRMNEILGPKDDKK